MQSSGSNGGCKPASLQAFKLQGASLQAFPQRLKLQALLFKVKDPSTRVQADLPLIRATSNKDKCI